MMFERQETIVPVSIGDIAITLRDYDSGLKDGRYEVQVRRSDGTVKLLNGNLLPHLTADQTATLITLLDDLRDKAEEQILPASNDNS